MRPWVKWMINHHCKWALYVFLFWVAIPTIFLEMCRGAGTGVGMLVEALVWLRNAKGE